MNHKKSNSKIILFYFAGMRSYLLYKDILERRPDIFDCVIRMPAIPYKRSTGKRDIRKIFKVLIDSPGFFFMHLFTVKIFNLLTNIFNTSIRDICSKNKIDYYSYNKIDQNLIDFIRNKKPVWIISSTSTILTKDFIEIPLHGVINFHEAPLPQYKGSASYFWFIVNHEKFANTTVHYVSEGLDTGDIIYEGPEVVVNQPTVFTLWLKMLLSHKNSWDYLLPYLIDGRAIPSFKQPKNDFKAYSYPDKKSINDYSSKIIFISYIDIVFIVKTAIKGIIVKIK